MDEIELAVWDCKIGYAERWALPHGSDGPMRRAVSQAFIEITGQEPEFIFSGWGGEFDESELAVVEDREPDLAVQIEAAEKHLAMLLRVQYEREWADSHEVTFQDG